MLVAYVVVVVGWLVGWLVGWSVGWLVVVVVVCEGGVDGLRSIVGCWLLGVVCWFGECCLLVADCFATC